MVRWKEKEKPSKEWDTKIKTSFLFFPKKISGETRWLEKASWKEQLTKEKIFVSANGEMAVGHSKNIFVWVPIDWVEQDIKPTTPR